MKNNTIIIKGINMRLTFREKSLVCSSKTYFPGGIASLELPALSSCHQSVEKGVILGKGYVLNDVVSDIVFGELLAGDGRG